LDLRNGVLKEGSILEDWKLSIVQPNYRGIGEQWSVDHMLLEKAMKVVVRFFEYRI